MIKQNTFRLTISKIDKLLFDDETHSVTLPGKEGEITMLAHHEPIIMLLKEGIITIRTPDGEKKIAISTGVLEASNNQVTVLV